MHARRYLSRRTMSRTINGWPILTLAGITAAILIGLAHTVRDDLRSCLLGYEDLGPRADTTDGFGPDGYGPP